MNEIFYFMISYAAIIVIAFFLIQWLTNGFLTKFLKVKASRGKKVLINVRGKLQHYFIAGEIIGDELVYRDAAAKKEGRKYQKRIIIKGDPFYRAVNVTCVNVDEAKNCIIHPSDLRGIPGYDAIKWSSILQRAIMSAKNDDSIIVIIILIIVIILIFLNIGVLVKLGAIETAVKNINLQSVITGGNV